MIPPKTILPVLSSEGARHHHERMVCQVLTARDPLQAAELARRVTDEMYYEELRCGAWVIDIGSFGPAIFEEEARELLESMVGRCLEVESGPIV